MFIKLILLFTIVSSITATDTMLTGYCLIKGSSIRSSNGCFMLSMQGDGNLVIYRDSDNEAIWSSGTFRAKSSMACVLEDGNFVVNNDANEVLWSTGTNDNTNSQVIMQDDGNLVVYNQYNKLKWASNTVTDC